MSQNISALFTGYVWYNVAYVEGHSGICSAEEACYGRGTVPIFWLKMFMKGRSSFIPKIVDGVHQYFTFHWQARGLLVGH